VEYILAVDSTSNDRCQEASLSAIATIAICSGK
jgi:hypothetical protein